MHEDDDEHEDEREDEHDDDDDKRKTHGAGRPGIPPSSLPFPDPPNRPSQTPREIMFPEVLPGT